MNPAVEDHLTPKESLPFPIVAIGASAGGLEAITALLNNLRADTGMAFVVIQHLSPTHTSLLSEILTRATRMRVAQVEQHMAIKPNHIYVIPPGKDLVIAEGHLVLAPRTDRGQQRPVDHFMRSLAEEHGHKAIGVVLSGTGNDGSLGVQEIKAGGGITFSQDTTAEQQGMPQNAIATGAIDFVLPPDEMGKELGRVARHPYVRPTFEETTASLHEATMQRILATVRQATGVDFDGYKRNTINRRVARRMVLHRIDELSEYARFLHGKPAELEALFQDLLINVTSFFRNPEAYEALKTLVFPKLTESRSRHEQVRIWALGCSTGEEAYSLAMAFTEYAEQSGRAMDAQIFATDLNGAGIDRARAGIYAKGIVQDVSPERLRRFFVEVDGSYRITKKIRDMCVFARQNVLADPPFSRLDLVACRNLLIYLEPQQQQRLIPMLHYALRNQGYLWLGGSETIGAYRELFDPLDIRHKIYAKKAVAGHNYVAPAAHRWEPHRGGRREVVAPAREVVVEAQREAERMLVSRYAPPSVVVNDALEIVQFRGDTGPFLAPAPGRATLGLLKMLREGLMLGVRSALQKARKAKAPFRAKDLRVRSNGGWRHLDVEVIPLKGLGAAGAYMVVFEESAQAVMARARQMHDDALAQTAHDQTQSKAERGKETTRLAQELAATREYLQSLIEQQEAANEELQSANEEVQSANEELQSINEELETSKEEIQSANEELATVNDELQNRNLELSR
ncbi:MAG TPA: chemotaxis protein CheB, partial [Burkholderiales bacterium]